MHWRRKLKRTDRADNSSPEQKLRLRKEFVAEASPGLCFDLFAGTGTFARALYVPIFAQVVLVDKKRQSLAQAPGEPNVARYLGDNRRLVGKLAAKYGAPDFVDLDAYGDPLGALVPLLKWMRGKRRFVLVATDTTSACHRSGAVLPESWGYGKQTKLVPGCLPHNGEWQTRLFRHLEAALGRSGHQIGRFVLERSEHSTAYYWGAVCQLPD